MFSGVLGAVIYSVVVCILVFLDGTFVVEFFAVLNVVALSKSETFSNFVARSNLSGDPSRNPAMIKNL